MSGAAAGLPANAARTVHCGAVTAATAAALAAGVPLRAPVRMASPPHPPAGMTPCARTWLEAETDQPPREHSGSSSRKPSPLAPCQCPTSFAERIYSVPVHWGSDGCARSSQASPRKDKAGVGGASPFGSARTTDMASKPFSTPGAHWQVGILEDNCQTGLICDCPIAGPRKGGGCDADFISLRESKEQVKWEEPTKMPMAVDPGHAKEKPLLHCLSDKEVWEMAEDRLSGEVAPQLLQRLTRSGIIALLEAQLDSQQTAQRSRTRGRTESPGEPAPLTAPIEVAFRAQHAGRLGGPRWERCISPRSSGGGAGGHSTKLRRKPS